MNDTKALVALPLPFADFAEMFRGALARRRRRPGRPYSLTVRQHEEVLTALAEGEKVSDIAPRFDVSEDTIYRVLAKSREIVAERQAQIQAMAAENVLREIASSVRARMIDAQNLESRTAPQSLQVALLAAGVGQKGDTHIHGDVHQTSVQAVQIAADPESLQRLDGLRGLLGF